MRYSTTSKNSENESYTPKDEESRTTNNNFRTHFLTVLFLALFANTLVVAWLAFIANLEPNIRISQPEPPELIELCPGQVFPFTFLLESDKATSVHLSFSIIQDSEDQRSRVVNQEKIYLDRPVAMTLTRQWVVPDRVPLVSGEFFDWEGGGYQRNVQVSIISGGDVEGEINYPFAIKLDCE